MIFSESEEWKLGDKVKVKRLKMLNKNNSYIRGKSGNGSLLWCIQVDYNRTEWCRAEEIINLSAIGRKAAEAIKNKVTRDPKTGRFAKKVEFQSYGPMPHGKVVKLSSTLSGQRELLRNHENRLKALEIGLCNCPYVPIRQDGPSTKTLY